MPEAKSGDTVKVHYTGRLEDGSQFDSSAERDPIEFKIGEGRVIPGFEQAIVGMKTGDSKKVEIPVEDGYGPRREDLVMVVDRSRLPNDLDPSVGERLELRQGDDTFAVMITEVSSESVTLDANHPLAGEILFFEVELVEVV